MTGGTHSSSVDLGIIPPPWSIAATGDFNGDGTTDIVWRNTTSEDTVIWFMNGGAVSSASDLGVVPAAWSIVH
jgi:hypothetical protein